MATIKCPYCEEENEKDDGFCKKCGKSLKCPKCGAQIKEDIEFCSKCGESISKKKTKSSSGGKKVGAILVVCILVGLGYFLYTLLSKYKMIPEERVAYSRLNLAAATSAYMGGGELSRSDLNILKEMVKKQSKNNEWFSSSYGFYARLADTDTNDITYLCDSNYCAKFTVDKNDYTLLDYEFTPSTEKGYSIRIVDKYSDGK